MRLSSSCRVTGVALLLLAGAEIRAGPAPVLDWSARFRDVSQDLHAANWTRALATVETLLTEMRETIASGAGAAPSLGVATMYRAVAEAGLGERESAAWDLWMAQSLLPAMAEADLQGFGEAGKLLDEERRSAEPAIAGLAGVARPAKLSGEVPRFPFGKAQVCGAGPVKVRVHLGADGVPRRPRVEAGTDPVLAYAAMDALRNWRFRPASRDGQPLAVPYTLTVDYRVLNCPGAAPGKPAAPG